MINAISMVSQRQFPAFLSDIVTGDNTPFPKAAILAIEPRFHVCKIS
jgi:hypothetical protein